jgi:hypothetical protein
MRCASPPTWVAPVLWLETVMGVGFVPTHYIDITPHIELKRTAIRAHQSQDPERFVQMAELGGRYRSAQCNANEGYAEVFRFEPVFPFGDPRNLLPPAPGVQPVRDRGASRGVRHRRRILGPRWARAIPVSSVASPSPVSRFARSTLSPTGRGMVPRAGAGGFFSPSGEKVARRAG